MENINWRKNFQDHFIPTFHEGIVVPGTTGVANIEGIDIDIDIHLRVIEITNFENFVAEVIRFDPPAKAIPGLEVGKKVEVGIQHFKPNQ